MAPKPEGLKLSQDAFKNEGGQQKRGGRPEGIRLVIGGTGGIQAIDKLTYSFKEQGHVGKETTKLAGIVYEMAAGEKADQALDSFKVAFESPGNIPVTLIHPLNGAVDAGKIPPLDTPPQFAQICFSLPTVYKASDVQGANESKWLDVLKVASERSLTIEMAVAPNEEARDAVEKLLGKSWDNDVSKAKEAGKDVEEAAGKKGVRILFDDFGSPPLGQSSTQLMRSPEMKSWNDFVSRLALDPRVYLKLSPLPQPSAVLPTAVSVHRRQADALGSGVPVATALGSAAQAAIDTATQAVSAAEAASVTSTADRRDELQQRLRFFLETALEAFGEERLVFSSYLTSGSGTVTAIQGHYKDDAAHLSEPEQWFEAVLATLHEIGVGQEAIDNIFSNNVSKVYLM